MYRSIQARDEFSISAIWQHLFFTFSFNEYVRTTGRKRSCTRNGVKTPASKVLTMPVVDAIAVERLYMIDTALIALCSRHTTG
ncbi:hypothetical protein [Nostoc sp. C117]|uniref:hypothetical protein n=1 Tax=Nostoc sp. C117 TaxID=3349875 RepID=UPI00370D83F5